MRAAPRAPPPRAAPPRPPPSRQAPPDLLVVEMGENLAGDRQVGHRDRLGGRAEQGLDRLAELGLHVESLADRGHRPAAEERIEAALQQGLGALAEALPLFLKLLEQAQPRRALRERRGRVPAGAAARRGNAGSPPGGRAGRPAPRCAPGSARPGRPPAAPARIAARATAAACACAHLRALGGELRVPDRAGLRIDLVPGAVGAQPRHGALELQKVELGLLEQLLLPAEFALDDRELAVALLENGIGTAEQIQELLLVGGAAVHLRAHLPQLHLEFRQVVAARLDALLEAGPLDPGETGLVLRLFLLGTQVEGGLLRVLQALVVVAAARLELVQVALAHVERRTMRFGRGPQAGDVGLQPRDRGAELAALPSAVRQAEMAEPETEPLVTHRLRGLAAQAADLAADLGDDVGDARQVLVGQGELAERLPALALVARDARRLLEDRAALLGLRGQHLVDLPLRHDRVRGAADAGVHEKLVDVLEPAGLAVEEIVALPRRARSGA